MVIAVAQVLAERVENLNKERGTTMADISKFKFEPDIYKLVPDRILKVHKMIPLNIQDGVLTVACTDPSNLAGLDEIRRIIRGVELNPVGVSEKNYNDFLAQHQAVLKQSTPGQTAKTRIHNINWISDDANDPEPMELGDKRSNSLSIVLSQKVSSLKLQTFISNQKEQASSFVIDVQDAWLSGKAVSSPLSSPGHHFTF